MLSLHLKITFSILHWERIYFALKKNYTNCTPSTWRTKFCRLSKSLPDHMTDWVQQFKPHCALCKTLFIFKGIFNKENRYSKTTWIHVYALHIAFQTLQLQSKQRSFHLNPKTVTEWNKRTKLTLPLSVQRCHLVDKELYFSTPTFFQQWDWMKIHFHI